MRHPSETSCALFEGAWVEPGYTAVSVQVLQEIHVNFVRRGHPPEKASSLVGDCSLWPIIDNSPARLRLGISLQSRWQRSLWAAMIVGAAKVSGVSELLSEDLSHGQDYGGVRVINPFPLARSPNRSTLSLLGRSLS